MRTAILVVAALIAAGLIAAVVGGRMLLAFVGTPHAAEGAEPRVIDVAPDVSPEALSSALAAAGVVGRPSWFALYLESLHRGEPIKPGEYSVSASMSPAEIVDRMARGAVVTYPITVAPGDTVREVVAALATAGLASKDTLETTAKDPAFLGKLGVPSTTVEGFLFADTYSFAKGLTAEAILERMVQAYQRGLPQRVLEDARTRGYTEAELITVASLIEASGLPEREWSQYAGVLHNRLADKLPLEHDAALAYGLGKAVAELVADDRATDAPYNTFVKPGLPPTPIGTPGLAALAAAANPQGDARYFAPRPDDAGGHTFCPDEECHRIALDRAGLPMQRSFAAGRFDPRKKKGR